MWEGEPESIENNSVYKRFSRTWKIHESLVTVRESLGSAIASDLSPESLSDSGTAKSLSDFVNR